MTVEIIELEPLRYAYLSHVGAYPEIGATFGRLAVLAGAAGLIGGPDALFIGVYPDDPSKTSVEELKSDAGITVSREASIPEDLHAGTLPGGRYAKGIHKGSYERMGESWRAFWNALGASGVKGRSVSPFELYVSDMETTPEEELITELYAAVE